MLASFINVAANAHESRLHCLYCVVFLNAHYNSPLQTGLCELGVCDSVDVISDVLTESTTTVVDRWNANGTIG